MAFPNVLVVTNDFPPRVGGLQRYLHDLVRHLPPDHVTVFAPQWPGWRTFDAAQPFRVSRWPGTVLAPTEDAMRRIRRLIAETNADVLLIGHGLPLGLGGPKLVADPGIPYVLLTGGWEVMQVRVPGVAGWLRRACSSASAVLALSDYTRSRIRRVVPDHVPLEILSPGVDAERFHPDGGGEPIRERLGLDDEPVVVCVSRLVRRKGQDVLIKGLPRVLARIPEARLLVVGSGTGRKRLAALASAKGVASSVIFTGEVPDEALPEYYRAGDVFAMPCRSQFAGLEVEGFGIVFLEAAACERASIAGRSGGAAEAVEDGVTGLVVDGADVVAVADSVLELLKNPERASAMGRAGRERVEQEFDWPRVGERLAGILAAATR